MKRESKLIHTGDRKKAGNFIPVTTPIYTAASYFYDSMDQLDRVLGKEEAGPCYARYDNPTTGALEELVAELEGAHGAIATSLGHGAVHLGIAGRADRPATPSGRRARDLRRHQQHADEYLRAPGRRHDVRRCV